MKTFKQSMPYTVAAILLIPEYKTIKGVPVKSYPEKEKGIRMNCSFKTYGGTESENNGLYTVLDTGNIETWYRPDIKSDCKIHIPQKGGTYEIIGEPENIDMRNQCMKMKVQRVKGGA